MADLIVVTLPATPAVRLTGENLLCPTLITPLCALVEQRKLQLGEKIPVTFPGETSHSEQVQTEVQTLVEGLNIERYKRTLKYEHMVGATKCHIKPEMLVYLQECICLSTEFFLWN
ncbi:unnamed protein product [Allacma fusca]|uniref:Uncharacterized protein n=1 Tax=Allacma fusca TaxID=39272 RepID=A0A8J2KTP4_9HEXA|nr:unnamed protein product [Allacma fusca]